MGARTFEVADGFEANELFGRNGWTDGLPIVPPTPELVRAALHAALLEPDRILGVEPVRGLAIRLEICTVDGNSDARCSNSRGRFPRVWWSSPAMIDPVVVTP